MKVCYVSKIVIESAQYTAFVAHIEQYWTDTGLNEK